MVSLLIVFAALGCLLRSPRCRRSTLQIILLGSTPIITFEGFSSTLTNRNQSSQQGAIELQMLQQARYFMPKSLGTILAKYRRELESGFESMRGRDYLHSGKRSLLEGRLIDEMSQISRQLRSQPRFSKLARELGLVARMVIWLNIPEADTLTEEVVSRFLQYVEKNCQNFPLVVYDDPAQAFAGPEDLLQQIRSRREQISTRYKEIYPRQLEVEAWNDFDARSPMFGISSLFYSHSINDIAAFWLWAWSSANGDMSGRPIFHNGGAKP